MTGFEPATPSSRTKCATKLRYIPRYLVLLVGLEAHYVLPLRKRYLIVFFGRVKLRYIPIFSCQVENFRFQRCATTSRKNNSPDCFFSAECYIPILNCQVENCRFQQCATTSRSLTRKSKTHVLIFFPLPS